MDAGLLTYIWLTVLSLAVAGLFILQLSRWHRTNDRLDRLDIAEKLQEVLQAINRDAVKRNRELEAGIRELLRLVEANPALCSAHWHDIMELKRLIQ